MPGIQIGTNRPPEDSPAYHELYRLSPGRSPVRRWSGRSCQQVPDGMQFWQLDGADRQRYEQAGCSYLGAQPARRSMVVSGGRAGAAPRTTWLEAWCCQPDQVVPVFEQWVEGPEYQRNKRTGLYFAIAMIGGIGALFLFRKQLGLTMGGERTKQISWAANPDFWSDDDLDDWDDEE